MAGGIKQIRRDWKREELILALNLYLKIPFGKMHKTNPDVIHLAKIIDRTSGSIAMRLGNYASVDPYHQKRGVRGLPNGMKQVQPIWNEFIKNRDYLLFESERILAEKEKITIESKFADILEGTEHLKGEYKIREVKTRVNQDVFRRIVMTNYNSRCAISGIDIPDLLVASHIIPWSENDKERLNPENGICFSPLYDKAYDKGYIGVNEDFEILIAPLLLPKVKEIYFDKYLGHLTGTKLCLPEKYFPKKEFLQYHMKEIFNQPSKRRIF